MSNIAFSGGLIGPNHSHSEFLHTPSGTFIGPKGPDLSSRLPQEIVYKIDQDSCVTLKVFRRLNKPSDRSASLLLFRIISIDVGSHWGANELLSPKLLKLCHSKHRLAVRMIHFRSRTPLGLERWNKQSTVASLGYLYSQFVSLRALAVENVGCDRAGDAFFPAIQKCIIASQLPRLNALSSKNGDLIPLLTNDNQAIVARVMGSLQFVHLNLNGALVSEDRTLEALKYAQNLEALHIIGSRILRQRSISHIHSKAPLRQVFLTVVNVPASFLCGLRTFRDSLEELDMANVTLTKGTWEEVVKELLACPLLVDCPRGLSSCFICPGPDENYRRRANVVLHARLLIHSESNRTRLGHEQKRLGFYLERETPELIDYRFRHHSA
ncbi:hypothetical protein BJX62DRAFT_238204 [Aspergillus germanicus]